MAVVIVFSASLKRRVCAAWRSGRPRSVGTRELICRKTGEPRAHQIQGMGMGGSTRGVRAEVSESKGMERLGRRSPALVLPSLKQTSWPRRLGVRVEAVERVMRGRMRGRRRGRRKRGRRESMTGRVDEALMEEAVMRPAVWKYENLYGKQYQRAVEQSLFMVYYACITRRWDRVV